MGSAYTPIYRGERMVGAWRGSLSSHLVPKAGLEPARA